MNDSSALSGSSSVRGGRTSIRDSCKPGKRLAAPFVIVIVLLFILTMLPQQVLHPTAVTSPKSYDAKPTPKPWTL